MSLTVSAKHRLGAFSIDATFASDGGVTALFGRSGSGKTTLVNIIAGLILPDEARITVNGETVTDTSRRITTPVHRRRFGYVFQEARLFSHLSVRRNLVYGQWFSLGFSRALKAGMTFERIVDMLDVGHLLDRPAAHLSGGEKQRIAIGRALLSRPRLLLMDEPLASLDETRKAEILPYLERLRDEMAIPIVYVSHSVTEVARLANHVVLVEAGRVVASGDAAAVLNQPSPAVGRREAGTLVEGIVEAEDARITTVRAGPLSIRVPDLHLGPGKPIRLQIAARDVMLSTQKPEGLSALNVFEGTVTAIGTEIGGMVDVTVDCRGLSLVARITGLSCENLGLEPGKPVHAIIKSVALDR